MDNLPDTVNFGLDELGLADGEDFERGSEDGSGIDHYSSNGSVSGSGSSSTGYSNVHKNLGAKESVAVNRSKWMVYVILLFAATAVGATTYIFLDREEYDDFTTEFDSTADAVLDAAENKATLFFGKLVLLSNTLTSYAQNTNSLWPNVTVPNFDIRTVDALNKDDSLGPELFLFAPLVTADNTAGFTQYAQDNQGWISQDLSLRGRDDIDPGTISDVIWSYTGDAADIFQDWSVPVWQLSPAPTDADIIMMDLYTQASFVRMIDDVMQVEHTLLSEVVRQDFLAENIQTLDRDPARDIHPRSYAVEPVYDRFINDDREGERTFVGFIFTVVPWDSYFVDALPDYVEPVVVEVINSCGLNFFYLIDGREVKYLGQNYTVPDEYVDLAVEADFAEFARYDDGTGTHTDENDYITHCEYVVKVYPTEAFEDQYNTSKPLLVSLMLVCVFVFTALVFYTYDYYVQRRQTLVLTMAQRSAAVVSSLFPKSVQKRILGDHGAEELKIIRRNTFSAKHHLKNFLKDGTEVDNEPSTSNGSNSQLVAMLDQSVRENYLTGVSVFKTKPIADLFLETTIMFADIVGFTAWSSTREPSQVFTLLETIYHEFDGVAKRRRVFKVETVGDCYVAVCGLPDPCKDHAIVMARFARECLLKLLLLTKKLEVVLGPDTGDLAMRIGLHSGPVTAGVLRGERARFQLFGDTMNTASRMESTGKANHIQISQETATKLAEAGKGSWFVERDELVLVKGKGELKTYWLEAKIHAIQEQKTGDGVDRKDFYFAEEADFTDQIKVVLSDRVQRLVSWNVDLLKRLLQEILARRKAKGTVPDSEARLSEIERSSTMSKDIPLTEVCEIITLPEYRKEYNKFGSDDIHIPTAVDEQLRSFLTTIAQMYHENPFHNFEHASHVTMSVVKLFSRIVAPDLDTVNARELAESLHDHTYGITSDPLTQFAVVLSALIHDVDHPGVPNMQLIKEKTELARVYNEKSIAEQNSVDLAWELLMLPEYKDLRRTLYVTENDYQRFRQTLVNTVLATDIMDKSLKVLRNSRWDKAFHGGTFEESMRDASNRKATIVIEHLIQASDVAHTMQHWHIYRKWNARLFEEMYKAYIEGRSDNDPSENWYKGEIGFFDFYIIPLAKKLKECGVFGVSSDEYLQYATNNRHEWEAKGQDVVAELIRNVQEKYPQKRDEKAAEEKVGEDGSPAGQKPEPTREEQKPKPTAESEVTASESSNEQEVEQKEKQKEQPAQRLVDEEYYA